MGSGRATSPAPLQHLLQALQVDDWLEVLPDAPESCSAQVTDYYSDRQIVSHGEGTRAGARGVPSVVLPVVPACGSRVPGTYLLQARRGEERAVLPTRKLTWKLASGVSVWALHTEVADSPCAELRWGHCDPRSPPCHGLAHAVWHASRPRVNRVLPPGRTAQA